MTSITITSVKIIESYTKNYSIFLRFKQRPFSNLTF